MQIILHKINSIKQLIKIPHKYGVEVDVRGFGKKILLSHDPIKLVKNYDELEHYLQNFNHAFIIFNIKEAGYEKNVIELAKKYKIKNYFLLDVEFPFFYQATRNDGIRKIAIRYSEAEPIEYAEAQVINGQALVDWIWIDTNTKLPLDKKNLLKMKLFKTCLVCPERWGRPQDIALYIEKMKQLNFKPDAVMTSEKNIPQWEKF